MTEPNFNSGGKFYIWSGRLSLVVDILSSVINQTDAAMFVGSILIARAIDRGRYSDLGYQVSVSEVGFDSLPAWTFDRTECEALLPSNLIPKDSA